MKRLYIYFAAIALCMSATAPAKAGLLDVLRDGIKPPVVCVPPQVLEGAKCITPSAAATAPRCDRVAGSDSICLVTSACNTQVMCLKGALKGKCGTYNTCKASADAGPVCTKHNITQRCTTSNGQAGTFTRTSTVCDGVTTGTTDSPCVATPVTCTSPKVRDPNTNTCIIPPVTCTPPKVVVNGQCVMPVEDCPDGWVRNAQGQCVTPPNTSGCAPQGTAFSSTTYCVINPSVCSHPATGECNPLRSGGLKCGSAFDCKNAGIGIGGGGGGGSGCTPSSDIVACTAANGQPGTAINNCTCSVSGVKSCTPGQCTATPCPSGTTWNATARQCVKNGGGGGDGGDEDGGKCSGFNVSAAYVEDNRGDKVTRFYYDGRSVTVSRVISDCPSLVGGARAVFEAAQELNPTLRSLISQCGGISKVHGKVEILRARITCGF